MHGHQARMATNQQRAGGKGKGGGADPKAKAAGARSEEEAKQQEEIAKLSKDIQHPDQVGGEGTKPVLEARKQQRSLLQAQIASTRPGAVRLKGCDTKAEQLRQGILTKKQLIH